MTLVLGYTAYYCSIESAEIGLSIFLEACCYFVYFLG